MEELQKRLMEEVGLTQEQVVKVDQVIRGFITEKFPMLAGMVDSLFGSTDSANDEAN